MSNKQLFISTALCIVVLLVLQQFVIRKSAEPEDIVLEKLEELDRKINILTSKKDSIQIVIKTIDNQILTKEKYYEKAIDAALVQPTHMDSCYVVDYIDRFIATKGSNYNLYRTRKTE